MNSETRKTYIRRRQNQLRNAPIDGQVLKFLIGAGLSWLRTNQEIVNALNVYPVPDGDTGINMVLTMQAAYDEIANSPESNFGKMIHAVAHGALMGARGNSGVILSQIWRGVARAADNIEVLDGPTLVAAFCEARDTAYQGVVRPVEGTILTVAKDIAKAAEESLAETEDPISILERVIKEADESVERTPDLLDVLKKAGVVDAGGKGLFYILEGMLRFINGESLDIPLAKVQPLSKMVLEDTYETIEPGQDFEVVVDFRPHGSLDLRKFYDGLEQIGTSIQVGEGDGLYRMHIHVEKDRRYEPIDFTMSLGTITKVAIENLIEQMEQIERESGKGKLNLSPVEPGNIAVIAVSPGSGISRVFASLGVAGIVEGGQTMNPSTEDILDAFEDLPTDKVIVLPNNKNIIMAAKSAADITVKNVAVIPSRTIPQGLAAMFRLNPQGDFEEIVAEMNAAIDEIETGEVTTATRSVEIDGVSVKEGETIGLLNGKLVTSARSLKEACSKLIEKADPDQFELLTLFYGEDVTKQDANQIADAIRAAYPHLEIELQDGGQPHYQFIISFE
ncbi:MAG: DAK2 domain-containing protein [Chloroflexota bacterium]|nr:MAG: DAK2 domain-containing protein [Chloroflexota bacterium]